MLSRVISSGVLVVAVTLLSGATGSHCPDDAAGLLNSDPLDDDMVSLLTGGTVLAAHIVDGSRVAKQLHVDIGSAPLRKAMMPADLLEYAEAIVPDRGYGHISQHVEYHNVWEALLTLPMRKPRLFNVLVATLKTWAADICVQLVEIRARPGTKTGVDWYRSLAFAIFGFFYVGVAQWGLYVSLLTYLAPNAIEFSNEPWSAKLHNIPGQEDLLKQVLMDNLFFNAFIYFPAFYMLKEFVNSGFSRFSALGDGLRMYHHNFISDNALSMLFWVPGDFIAFAAPIYMRLPLDHLVSFSWTMVLSYRRGAPTATPSAAGCAEHGPTYESIGLVQGPQKEGVERNERAEPCCPVVSSKHSIYT